MDRLTWLRAQRWLIHDLDNSRAAMWPPDLERATTAPRPILTDAFCCLHTGGEVLAFAPEPRVTVAESDSSNDCSHEPNAGHCRGLEGTVRLDVMVVSQTPGMPPSLFTTLSSNKGSSPTASGTLRRPESPNTDCSRGERSSVPACYLRLGRDVFWLNHTAICRLTLPPLDELPENVPPYLDLELRPSSSINPSNTSSGRGGSSSSSAASNSSTNASNFRSSGSGSGSSSSHASNSNCSHIGHEPVVTLRCWANASVLSPTAAHGKLAAFAHNLQACLSASLVYPTHTLFKARGPIAAHVDASPTVTSSDRGNTGSERRRGSANSLNSSSLCTSQVEARQNSGKNNNKTGSFDGTYMAESSNGTPVKSGVSCEKDTEPQTAHGANITGSLSGNSSSIQGEESTDRTLWKSQSINGHGSMTVGGAFGPQTALALMAGPEDEGTGDEVEPERKRRGRRAVAASPLDDVCKQMAFSQHLDCPPPPPPVPTRPHLAVGHGDASITAKEAAVAAGLAPGTVTGEASADLGSGDKESTRLAQANDEAFPMQPGSEEQHSSGDGESTTNANRNKELQPSLVEATATITSAEEADSRAEGSIALGQASTDVASKANGSVLKAHVTEMNECSENEGEDDEDNDTDDVGSGLSCPLGQETPLSKRNTTTHHQGNQFTSAPSTSSRAAGSSGARKRSRAESASSQPELSPQPPLAALAPGFLACLGTPRPFHEVGGKEPMARGMSGEDPASSKDVSSSSEGSWVAVAAVERLYDQWCLFTRAADLLTTTSRHEDNNARGNGVNNAVSSAGATTLSTNGGPATPLATAGTAATAGVFGCNSSWAAVTIGQWRRALGSTSSNNNNSNSNNNDFSPSSAAAAAASAEHVGQMQLCASALSSCTLPWPAYVQLEREVHATAAACRIAQDNALDSLLATSQAKPLSVNAATEGSAVPQPAAGRHVNVRQPGDAGKPSSSSSKFSHGNGDEGARTMAQAVEALDRARAAVARAEAAVELLAALPIDAPGALFKEPPSAE